MKKSSINMNFHHLFIFSVLLHFYTIVIALRDVVDRILLNVAGLGKGITVSSVATENVFQHESNAVGEDLQNL